MSGKDRKKSEKYDLVGGDVLSPTLTVEEKTDEEVYKEAFDHFDGNHSKTIPTSVSWNDMTSLSKIHEFISRALSMGFGELG